ncbi:signal recognition particle 19 kDa protein isoform X1 [Hydra vulgaris]|nr:signal recognition particle 19 kDa protein [Hydra vulgaris]
MAHNTSDPSSQQRWVIIYPSYINSCRTKEEGRKIAKSKAVENPKAAEIRDVLQYHNFNTLLEENKQYPRDSFKDALCKGRVKVQIKQADGTPVSLQYPTRKALMLLLAEMIPKLKGRQLKGASAETAGSTTNSKKKTKKK